MPYWNYQGVASFGTFSDRQSFRPSGPGLTTSCPILGNPTTPRCVVVQWQFGHSAYDQNRGNITWRSWHGILLEGKRDRSSLDYRRARVYDPETGRFTQEDPIGLAGGLNLYGFANGDPVNFSDPFGRCPKAMRQFTARCDAYNKQQADRARQIVQEEIVRGNPDALGPVPSGERITGLNDDETHRRCVEPTNPKAQTFTGCQQGGLIFLNADRPAEAIAATLVHERQHAYYPEDAVKGGELCAKWRGANFGLRLPAARLAVAIQDPYFDPFLAGFVPPKGCF